MANKLVAVFLVCIVVAAAMQFQQADAGESKEKYPECFKKCMKACDEDSHHYTFCEVKCDEDCEDGKVHLFGENQHSD